MSGRMVMIIQKWMVSKQLNLKCINTLQILHPVRSDRHPWCIAGSYNAGWYKQQTIKQTNKQNWKFLCFAKLNKFINLFD